MHRRSLILLIAAAALPCLALAVPDFFDNFGSQNSPSCAPAATPTPVPAATPRPGALHTPTADELSQLQNAARAGDTSKANDLLRQGVPIDSQDSRYKETALMHAADAGKTEMVRMLIGGGAKLNIQNVDGRTALFWAAYEYYPNCVAALVDAGADPNIADRHHQTALIRSANGRGLELKKLLAAHADVNVQDSDGVTALMQATAWHNVANVKALIQAGADVNLENKNGETALIKAGQRGWLDLVDILQQAGAKKTKVFLPKEPPSRTVTTPAQEWALAASAILTQYNGFAHRELGFAPGTRLKAKTREELAKWWDVIDRSTLLSALQWLLLEGQRDEYRNTNPMVKMALNIQAEEDSLSLGD